ncbi:jg23488, partial [Pararge aegeria aegeria]
SERACSSAAAARALIERIAADHQSQPPLDTQ